MECTTTTTTADNMVTSPRAVINSQPFCHSHPSPTNSSSSNSSSLLISSQSPPPNGTTTHVHNHVAPPTLPQQQQQVVIMSPCAACKILRRRCVEKCVLAPYFPPTEPLKFTIAHRVFGASNIIKLLQELPETQRADAVSSMVYEANARIRDPVYGCAGAICQLQKQVSELQAELAKAQADVVNLQCQQSSLLTLICMEMTQAQQLDHLQPISTPPTHYENLNFFPEDNGNLTGIFEPLWTW